MKIFIDLVVGGSYEYLWVLCVYKQLAKTLAEPPPSLPLSQQEIRNS